MKKGIIDDLVFGYSDSCKFFLVLTGIMILGMVKWYDDVLRWWCDGVVRGHCNTFNRDR